MSTKSLLLHSSEWDCKTIIMYYYPAEKNNKTQNTIENVMDLMVIMGIVLVLMETITVSTGM